MFEETPYPVPFFMWLQNEHSPAISTIKFGKLDQINTWLVLTRARVTTHYFGAHHQLFNRGRLGMSFLRSLGSSFRPQECGPS